MARKTQAQPWISNAAIQDQISKDKRLFDNLPLNIRKARREELEDVWPSEFLPDAEDPGFDFGEGAGDSATAGNDGS